MVSLLDEFIAPVNFNRQYLSERILFRSEKNKPLYI